jgi:hypothetical protein
MDNKKMEFHPIEYNFVEKYNPYFFTKQIKLSRILRSIYTKSNDTINIEFDEYYRDAVKLRDDIVSYIRNEKHLYCEALDFNHFLIDGKPYVLNVTHGIASPGGGFFGQSTILYKEDI